MSVFTTADQIISAAAVRAESPLSTPPTVYTWYFTYWFGFFGFFLDSEISFFFFEGVGAFLFQLRTVQNRLPGGIGSSNINVCQCYQGYSVAGLSMPLLKVLVN